VRQLTPLERVSDLTFTLKNEIIKLLESILERITKMKTYSIVDLLVDQYYAPRSISRRFNGGIINYAEKRENVYLSEGYEAYSIRFRPTGTHSDQWATVAVKVAD
jgi:hypothetical protein